MNREKVGKVVAVAGNIVSGACLVTLIVLTVADRIVTGSVTGLQAAFTAGAALLLAGGIWATTHPVTPQED